MNAPPYRDDDYFRRMESAMRQGYIQREKSENGVPHYKLTMLGKARWVAEQMFGGFGR